MLVSRVDGDTQVTQAIPYPFLWCYGYVGTSILVRWVVTWHCWSTHDMSHSCHQPPPSPQTQGEWVSVSNLGNNNDNDKTCSLTANTSEGCTGQQHQQWLMLPPPSLQTWVDSVLGNDDGQCHPLHHCKCEQGMSFFPGWQQWQQWQPTPSPPPPLTCKHEMEVFLSSFSSGQPPHH
jgi:hypothetical protein